MTDSKFKKLITILCDRSLQFQFDKDMLRQLIEAVGAKLIYLPPYSPDMNPIEKVWANLKRLIRVHPQKEQNLDIAIKESINLLFIK